ncbi:MAG: zinc ribbon domain-containing protein [Candidatus Krumholzibacteria bacterium]|nr:zinc ribbon domain-containing protein [Candidatus Krumholzibacteria bacterium]
MLEEPSNDDSGRAGGERSSVSECAAAREEIMTTALEGGALSARVSVHIAGCEPCRAWETEFARMHRLCREAGPAEAGRAEDPSGLTMAAIERGAGVLACPDGRTRTPSRVGGKTSDRGILVVVLSAVVLFNLILAFMLGGGARLLYPAAGFVVMLVSGVLVYLDSTSRKMPAAFWTALAAFTVPVGIVAYLVCRGSASSRCPSCGCMVPAGKGFCPGCGGKLIELCCGCGKPVLGEFRVCPFCGTRLEKCSPREDKAGGPCGWSSRHIAFVAVVNVALLAGLLAALLWGEARTSLIASCLYLFGYFPVFNWVSIDSRRRSMSTIFWGALMLATLHVGLVIYCAWRKGERISCPVCGSYPPASFNFCPCCGSALGAGCPYCGGGVGAEDRFCACCGARLVSADASLRSRG